MPHSQGHSAAFAAIFLVSGALEWIFGIRIPLPIASLILLALELAPVIRESRGFRPVAVLFRFLLFTVRSPAASASLVLEVLLDLYFRDGVVDSPFPLWIVSFWRNFTTGLARGTASLTLRAAPPAQVNRNRGDPNAAETNRRLRRELAFWADWLRLVLVAFTYYCMVFNPFQHEEWQETLVCGSCQDIVREMNGQMSWAQHMDGPMTRVYHRR